jgi:ABC-type nitrate/sulfonate/bicarbonate transport system substrate-binding protein
MQDEVGLLTCKRMHYPAAMQQIGSGPSRPIAVGSFTPSVVLEVSRRIGALRSAGLDVDELPVPSSPSQFSSLRDGELDVALTSPDNVLAYRFAPGNPLGTTLDAKIIGSVDRGLGLGLYGRPGLTSPDQLRGARVGVDVPTSGFALALYALADSLGVDRNEYRLETLGSTPRRLEALLDGRCDATMLNAGNELRAEAAGCRLLAAVPDVCHPYLGTVVAVVGDGHAAAAGRLARALSDTSARILEGGLDEGTAEAAADVLGLTADLARRYVERLKDPEHGLTMHGVDREALRTLVDLRRRYLPELVGGRDVLDEALDPARGLVLDPGPLP